jgi:RNA polymerase sigma-70 factor (ECF subfamily)
MDGQSTAVPQPRPDHLQLTAHYGWVHAVARNLVRDPWGAEDITQETLLAALATPPPDVPDDQRLRAWLARVAFNLSRLGARQGARRRAREVRVARRESLPSVTDELESAGTLQALSSAIAELAEPYRGVVLMRYFDGLSTAEIAARTETSELAVRKRLWRARNKLRAALDHDPVSGRLLAALCPWTWFARGARTASLSGLAAGLALVAGATWWCGREEREGPEVAALRMQPANAELELESAGAALADEPERTPAAPRSQGYTRRPLPPPFVPERAPTKESDEPRSALAHGVVLALDGQPRAGFELFDPRTPDQVLATSDALGGFGLPVREAPPRLAGRAPGWTTIVAARLAAGSESLPQPLVVAGARDLRASVHDESGRPIRAAELALRCAESAFARIPYPVRLESAELRTLEADEQGCCLAADLPRGAGLTLCVRAPGFEPLELETLELGSEERFFLRALGPDQFLTGRVFFRDGRPAAGARVSLALASTSADADGRYRLPLRGVRPDSSLGAMDPYKTAAPTELRAFGARLSSGVDDVDLVLGEEHDPVVGQLVGDDAEGWSVIAFSKAEAHLDAEGNEEPAAITASSSDGSFSFRLPRGAYDLYAVAPDAPRYVQQGALETRHGLWQIELPVPPATEAFQARARTADGLLLAGARVEVRLRAEGAYGPRRMPWRELISDEQGALAFACEPCTQLELVIVHAAVGRQLVAVSAPQAPQQLVLPRASFVQVAAASPRAETCLVLDGEGRVLAVRGPLCTREHFGLQAGWSPVLEVPTSARWVEFQETGAASVRVPIEPRPDAVLQVRP